MKLDLNSAWESAVKLVGMNREMILVLGGVFFFLPYVVFSLLVPNESIAAAAATGERGAMMAAFNAYIAEYWWALVILQLIQTAGATAIMAVIGDPARPTVNEGMARGATLLPSQICVQILMSAAAFLILFIAIVLGALGGSEGLATLVALISLPFILYLVTRFSLAAPNIAIERTVNPLAAVKKSFALTRGNGFRLAAFYILLIVAFFVIGQVIALVISLLTAFMGASLADIVEAILTGILNGAFGVAIYAVLAAVHRQMAQAARVTASETSL